MLNVKEVTESIRNGATRLDVIEYIEAWLQEALTLADTLDEAVFSKGIQKNEDPEDFAIRVSSLFNTMQVNLTWIADAVQSIAYEYHEQEMAWKSRKEEGAENAG